ncbi:dTDP-glucose 4,6-dehydratase [Brevundimonas aveniformis]|uniref:dTDP-glucose 4,6-dehydratase n=1 Tax=Brevundimonas aveniformis TaxID=370977 RepID=UPI0024936D9B|nr:dTDP-glucose 4,6-dehydratase [Brevundimonas aveniformis]
MRVLVTGGCGFIGSAVVRALMARGVERVGVLDALTYAANPATLAAFEDRAEYAFFQADIRDRAAVAAALEALRPQAILHLAAETHVDRSIDGPGVFIETNLGGTQVMLEAAEDWRRSLSDAEAEAFRFVHVSTDEVFGALKPDDPPFTEDSPYCPRSPYAASKAGADFLARAWHETYGLPVIVTNCSNNYGPYQHPEKLIPLMTLRGLAGEDMPVYGDGLQVRDWLHVDDHAQALLAALDNGQVGDTYLIGARAERTNLEIVAGICAALDGVAPETAPHAGLLRHVPDRPGHDRRYAINPSRAERDLGWRATTDLMEGLSRTVGWYRDNATWWWPMVEAGGLARRGQGR